MLSFARDIRPLFTQEDIEHMLDVDPSLDLGSYDSVKAHANIIDRRVSLGEMPPDKPWPQEQVDKFKQWMDEQYPAVEQSNVRACVTRIPLQTLHAVW